MRRSAWGFCALDNFHSALDVVRGLRPDGPVICARPARAQIAVTWFLDHFPGEVLYAVKANPALWALDAVYQAGIRHFDVASEAEIAMISGRFPDARLAFMHPVKSRRAIHRAWFDFGVRSFVLDSADELAKILAETGADARNAPDLELIVRLRVANDGANLPLTEKFGAAPDTAPDLLRAARRVAGRLGVSFHVGSQMMRPGAYRMAMAEASRLIARAGVTVDVVDVGGGFPAIYPGQTPPPMRDYVQTIASAFDDMMVHNNAELWCEPGRALVADSASVLARVEMRRGDKLYLNDGAYGNLFDAAHCRWLYPTRLHRAEGAASRVLAPFGFYGPTCDSMDAMPGPFFLPEDVREGDFVEIGMLGAYGEAMATRFNGFGDSETVVVADQPFASMFGTETDPLRNPRRSGVTE